MARITADQAGGVNALAFLDMIAFSEIGAALLLASDDGYDVLVGATPQNPKRFYGYARHPHVLNRELDSTAAGRYQEIFPTWVGLQAKLGLPDFSPISQDLSALELLRQRHALPPIDRGDIARAIVLCNPEWASFPGAGYGQHENSIAHLLEYYQGALARYT